MAEIVTRVVNALLTKFVSFVWEQLDVSRLLQDLLDMGADTLRETGAAIVRSWRNDLLAFALTFILVIAVWWAQGLAWGYACRVYQWCRAWVISLAWCGCTVMYLPLVFVVCLNLVVYWTHAPAHALDDHDQGESSFSS